ncbi:MAG: hypothetical protein HY238_15230 [Acidobacteria bacterium]|nr:hypothetical protein [Acidobacteriota bacterium]
MASIEQAKSAETKTALANYTRQLSRLHVELGDVRVGRQEQDFVRALVKRLKLQRSRLEPLA